MSVFSVCYLVTDENVKNAVTPLDIPGLDAFAETQVNRFLVIVFFGPSVQEKPE